MPCVTQKTSVMFPLVQKAWEKAMEDDFFFVLPNDPSERHIISYLVECTLESPFTLGTIVPFLINNSEGNIFVWSSRHESN